MKRLQLALGLAIGLSSPLFAAAAPAKYEIALLEQKIVPAAGVDRAVLDAAAARAAADGAGKVHFLVQLLEAPDEAGRADLWRRGVELGGYVAGNAWMAAVPVAQIRSLAEMPELRFVLPWTADRKLHPRVKANDFASWTRDPERPGWVMVFVLLHHDAPLERIGAIAATVGGVAAEPVASVHGGTLWLPEGQLRALAENEEVLWIEEGSPPLGPTNDGVRAATFTDPLLTAPYSLDGSGVKLLVYDFGTVRPTHQSFDAGAGSRVSVIDDPPASNHATHMAGTAAGDGSGSAGGRGRGIATGAAILSAGYEQVGGSLLWDNVGDLEVDYSLARNGYKADLATNSLGANLAATAGADCSREGDYGVAANLIDLLVRGGGVTVQGPVSMIWAAGNERSGAPSPSLLPRGRCGANYGTIGLPACAKNPIQVGAIDSDGLAMTDFSSWGPCDDGRLAPVVVAPGCENVRTNGDGSVYSALATSDSAYRNICGTSMATAAVGGIVSLFVEDWRARFGAPKARPLPALVKAFLIHTARDLGQPGPDYIHGYGAVDAKAMIDTLRAGTGVLGTSGAPVVWGTDAIAGGSSQSRRWSVPAGTGELKASLAWDDAPAAPFAAAALVNDLTLILISPGGVVYDAFTLNPGTPEAEAAPGLNGRDNQEQVIVENPAPGTWTVRVIGANVPQGPQSYGLVYTAEPVVYDPGNCFFTDAGFESDDDGFTLIGGATRAAAPAAGHGAFSMQLGGAAGTIQEIYRDFSLGSSATRTMYSYSVYLATAETALPNGFGWDHFTAEIRNPFTNAVLAVLDSRSDGWQDGVWMRQFEADLARWKGGIVRVAFRVENDAARPTTFWLDGFDIRECYPPIP